VAKTEDTFYLSTWISRNLTKKKQPSSMLQNEWWILQRGIEGHYCPSWWIRWKIEKYSACMQGADILLVCWSQRQRGFGVIKIQKNLRNPIFLKKSICSEKFGGSEEWRIFAIWAQNETTERCRCRMPIKSNVSCLVVQDSLDGWKCESWIKDMDIYKTKVGICRKFT
jgi:hypothetical protein